MVIKWYWLVAAVVLIGLLLAWLCLGRDREVMRREISLATPMRMVEAAAMGIPVDIVRAQRNLEEVIRLGGGEERGGCESSADVPAGGAEGGAEGSVEVRERGASAGVSADDARRVARHHGLTLSSALASPRLPLREGVRVPKRPEDVRNGVDLTPRLPPTLHKQSEKSLAQFKKKGFAAKNVDKYYQGLTKRAAERVFGVKFAVDQRPPWMRSPETGRCLELDLLNEEIGVAIEYNGYQHYVFPNKWHPQTEEGVAAFLRGVRNDELKPMLCNKEGVYLIVVPYSAHDMDERAEEQIEAFIRRYHPEEQARLMQEEASRSLAYSPSENPGVVVTSHTLLDKEDVAEIEEDA